MTRTRKQKKWSLIAGISVVVLLAGIGYLALIVLDFSKTVKEIHEPIDRIASEKREEPIAFDKEIPFSILVLGVDERAGDAGRSDTMIVLTVNPETNSTKLVSIPRDTYTEIIGRNVKDKLNHAYAFGGITMAMDSVEHLLDIPIDYVVQVNMDSFKDIVDAVGGVTVNNALNFTEDGHTFNKGKIHLSGEEALDFVRMRKEDPRGDFGRQDRQKEVIQAVLRKGASFNNLLNYKSIFGAVSNNIRTNMTFDDMISIQKNYRSATSEIEQLHIEQGTGEKIDGIWYYMMDEQELVDIQDHLKSHLAL